MLEQILKLLNSLVSKYPDKPSSEPVMDSAIQTSPVLEQSVSNKLQDTQLEDSQLTRTSLNLEECQVETSPQFHRPHFGKRRFPLRGHYRKKRPLLVPKKNKLSVSNENSQPAKKCIRFPKPLQESHDQNKPASQDTLWVDNLVPVNKRKSAECFLTQLSSLSQDSSSSDCIPVESILEKLSAESKVTTPVKDGDVWQWFDSELDF